MRKSAEKRTRPASSLAASLRSVMRSLAALSGSTAKWAVPSICTYVPTFPKDLPRARVCRPAISSETMDMVPSLENSQQVGAGFPFRRRRNAGRTGLDPCWHEGRRLSIRLPHLSRFGPRPALSDSPALSRHFLTRADPDCQRLSGQPPSVGPRGQKAGVICCLLLLGGGEPQSMGPSLPLMERYRSGVLFRPGGLPAIDI